jgi:type III secretory pathway component EscT
LLPSGEKNRLRIAPRVVAETFWLLQVLGRGRFLFILPASRRRAMEKSLLRNGVVLSED